MISGAVSAQGETNTEIVSKKVKLKVYTHII